MTTWSREQEAIFRWFETCQGSLNVVARAGTGKTTVSVEGLRLAPRRMTKLAAAFDVARKDDLLARVPPGVAVRTLNSLGNGACQVARWGIQVDRDKGYRIARKLLAGARPRDVTALVRAASIAKAALARTESSVSDALDGTDLVLPSWIDRDKFCELTLQAVNLALKEHDVVDFDDQIHHAVHYEYDLPKYDVVLVDEAQDMTPAQVEMTLRCVKPGGSFVAVGDHFQAIGAYRGATGDALSVIRRRQGSAVLSLLTTYRCPKLVVAEANRYVDDLRAAPDAPDGVVRRATFDAFVSEARPGDLVLSRTGAPLFETALVLLARKVPASVRGRGIGDGLRGFIEGLRPAGVDDLRKKVAKWHEKERADAEKRARDTTEIDDRVRVVTILAAGVSTISDLYARMDRLFTEGPDEGRVVLSTVHRAKGSEAGRVFLFWDTFQPDASGDERNIAYVAVTRAREQLVYVEGVS